METFIIGVGAVIIALLYFITRKLKQIIMKQQEAAEKLNAVAAQQEATATEVTKVKGETQALQVEIQELKDAAANQADLSPELAASIDKVVTRSQAVADGVKAVDDLVADPAPTTTDKTYTAQTGETIVVSQAGDSPAAGEAVTVNGESLTTGATYVLSDGSTLVVGDDSKVVSFTAAA